MKRLWLIAVLLTHIVALSAQQRAQISVDAHQSLGEISPLVYGQFIEYMGRCIDGGIYDEGNSNSDSRGYRLDVLQKAKELSPTLLRFPGGTVAKTIHWEDGVGPKEERKAKKNLVWGGINNFHFGTCEFIEYCREIGAEPFLVVNIATGTPDEAANWVEYCNGTGDTYYANLRRAHGYSEPFSVKYWALGNEEGARGDAGRHQDPKEYAKDMWQFIKLMKLTDPTIKLVANGEGNNVRWNKTVLDAIGDAVDFLSIHYYAGGDNYSIYNKIAGAERLIQSVGSFIDENYTEKAVDWDPWYRFPPREGRIKIAFDEWGIWEDGEPPYGTTNTYDWRCALATAQYLNIIQRNAKYVGLASWAQMINILAPIMTNEKTSIRQTVFYPLKEYRQKSLGEAVSATAVSPMIDDKLQSVDVSATIDRDKKRMVLSIVNFNEHPLDCTLSLSGVSAHTLSTMTVLTADSFQAKNRLANPETDVVKTAVFHNLKKTDKLTIQGHSITLCEFELK